MPPKVDPKTPEKPATDQPSTAPTQKMANLTAVINKLSPENDLQVLLYSALVENQGALGFEQRDLGKKNANQPLTFWTSSPEGDISPPQVNLPSSLQALYHTYCLHVYGILDGGSDNSICMLSPVYVRQPAVAATGKFAACTNGEVGIFFYEAQENDKSLIVRKELPSESDGFDTFSNSTFLPGTYLGAAYDGSDAWVAYQGSNGIIVINNSGTNSVKDLNQNATAFHKYTPITLVFIPIEQWGVEGNETARGCLMIYWLNELEVIQRSWTIIKADGSPGDFSAAKGPGGKSPTATQHSQMSIVFDAKARKNYIYCYPKNAKPVVQIVEDSWSTF